MSSTAKRYWQIVHIDSFHLERKIHLTLLSFFWGWGGGVLSNLLLNTFIHALKRWFATTGIRKHYTLMQGLS